MFRSGIFLDVTLFTYIWIICSHQSMGFAGCEQLLATNNLDEMISSHNRSQTDYYPNNVHKCWQIISESGNHVKLSLREFHLQQKHVFGEFCPDWLRVYHGISAKQRTLHATLCGNQPHTDIISEGNSFTLIFHTDNSISNSGFLLHYSELPPGGLGSKEKVAIGVSIYLIVVTVIVTVVSYISCKNHRAIVAPNNLDKSKGQNKCSLQAVNRRVSIKAINDLDPRDERSNSLVQVFSPYRRASNFESFDCNFYYSKEDVKRKRKILPKLIIPPPVTSTQHQHLCSKKRKTNHDVIKPTSKYKKEKCHVTDVKEKPKVSKKKEQKTQTSIRIWPRWVYNETAAKPQQDNDESHEVIQVQPGTQESDREDVYANVHNAEI